MPQDCADDIWVVYDGECPLCSRYVLLYQLRERGQRVHLIDARSEHSIVGDIRARNLDLNDGMVVRWREQYYYGAEAMHLLATLASYAKPLLGLVLDSVKRVQLKRTLASSVGVAV